MPDDRTPIPPDLLAHIEAVEAIDAAIDGLVTHREAAAGAMLEVAGAHPQHDTADALALWDALKARGTRAPGNIMAAMGWPLWRLVGQLRSHTPELATLPGQGVPCVYVLLDVDEIVYVGRSTFVRGRIRAHLAGPMEFTSWRITECDSNEQMCDLEALLQQTHRPRYNRRIEQRGGGA